MARGEFDNLAGQGKPLSKKFDHHNPYVDLVTQKLNQVKKYNFYLFIILFIFIYYYLNIFVCMNYMILLMNSLLIDF